VQIIYKHDFKVNAIFYVVGYGRSASTELGTEISKKHGLHFYGEVKYLFRNTKDDLLTQAWLDYKNKISNFDKNIVKIKDSIFGILILPFFNELYSRVHEDIFCKDISYCDTSKTTLDSVLRPYNLRKNTKNHIVLVTYKRSNKDVIRSIWSGKNSDLERNRTTKFWRKVLSLSHFIVTKTILALFFKSVKVQDINNFVGVNLNIELLPGKYVNDVVYGNRSRKN